MGALPRLQSNCPTGLLANAQRSEPGDSARALKTTLSLPDSLKTSSPAKQGSCSVPRRLPPARFRRRGVSETAQESWCEFQHRVFVSPHTEHATPPGYGPGPTHPGHAVRVIHTCGGHASGDPERPATWPRDLAPPSTPDVHRQALTTCFHGTQAHPFPALAAVDASHAPATRRSAFSPAVEWHSPRWSSHRSVPLSWTTATLRSRRRDLCDVPGVLGPPGAGRARALSLPAKSSSRPRNSQSTRHKSTAPPRARPAPPRW